MEKLRVQREFDGVTGTAHSAGNIVTSLNRSIIFNANLDSRIVTNVNVPYYFNPIESVSLGSTTGVGVGNTITYTYRVSGNGISSTFVPTQQIFLQEHGFITGQKLLYSNGGGDSLSVYNGISTFSLPNNSFVYAINEGQNFLGLSEKPIGIGSTGAITGIGTTGRQLFFSSHGTGVKHSLKPQKTEITGFVQKNIGTVVCKEAHNLQSSDRVSLSVVPGITTTYVVNYNDVTKGQLLIP